MKYIKNIVKNESGMAMIIVLTACFVVLVTVGVSAALLANNLDKVSGRFNNDKASANAQSALERVRGMIGLNSGLLSGCSANDCINTSTGVCGACTILDLGNNNRHTVKINSITQPAPSGGGIGSPPTVGTVSLLATGYYKNIARQRSSSRCIGYCSVAGYNCGNDGCGSICGTCFGVDTCVSGVCTAPPTSCSDVTVECSDSCVEGDTCGGGTVIDATNNVIAVGGGCTDIDGTGCNSGDDSLRKAWDAATGTTGATDLSDGRTNAATLKALGAGTINPTYEAVKFCDDLSFNGFNLWYLPAQNELDALQTAINNGWARNFASDCYWSSTEVDSKTAYQTGLNGGGHCSTSVNKPEPQYIRCLRRY